MAKRASNTLLFLFLSLLYCFSSGTLVGLSYHARGSNEATSFLKQHNVSFSKIKAFVSNGGLSFDLYLNRNQLEALMFKHKPSSLYWLKTHLNIRTIVVTIDNGDGDDNDFTWILPTLKSLHSVKVSVAFPLSLLVKTLSSKHERDLCSVVRYLKKVKSFVVVESNLREETMQIGSVLPCNNARREHLAKSQPETTQHDGIYPTPTVVTVNPTPVTSTNPNLPVVTYPLTAPPVTNPVTTPITVPGAQPITNPVTTNPVVVPPVSNIPGQTWCIAREGVPDALVQGGLDYACGAGADCSQIQQGGSCFNPSTLHSHASYAFNSYFQSNPRATSCDFGGTAAMVNINPSAGSCVYPVSASAAPLTVTPVAPTPVVVPTPTVPTPTIPTPIPTVTNPAAPTVMNPVTVTPTPTWSTSPGSVGTPGVNASTGLGPEFGLDSPPGYPNSSSSNTIGSRPPLGMFLVLTFLLWGKIVLA